MTALATIQQSSAASWLRPPRGEREVRGEGELAGCYETVSADRVSSRLTTPREPGRLGRSPPPSVEPQPRKE
jgi:hypothetical protein